MSRFLDFQLRVYDLRSVGTAGRALRVVVGYPKSKIHELYDQQAEGAKDFDACVSELHQQNWPQLHQAFVSLTGLRQYREKRSLAEIRVPAGWIEADSILESELCVWQPVRDFGLSLPPYYIEATVTTATPTELKVTGLCPIEWTQTPATISSEVLRKLLPGENLSHPDTQVVQLELLGNRIFQPTLQLGDRVLARLFFPGEPR
jgi:hypothetical protein